MHADKEDSCVKVFLCVLHGAQTSADREMQSSMRALKALMNSVESAQANLPGVIQMNRLAAEQQVEKLIQDLEQEIRQLRKRSSMLTQLLHTEDCALMLQVRQDPVTGGRFGDQRLQSGKKRPFG